MMVYYNDNDPHACAWARELIKAGLVPEGDVDERSIAEVKAEDLAGYQQCHFFCGILGWAHALAIAGWPAARPVWTASLPCQPWSSAGKVKGEADARHLWPVFLRLVRECKPECVLGEQVASRAGREWLSRVRDDLEACGYAVGCADLPACCQGAPHIRQRLFWVAHAGRPGLRPVGQQMGGEAREDQGREDQRQRLRDDAGDGGTAGGLGDTNGQRREAGAGAGAGAITQSFWADSALVPCKDGKVRRLESGLQPLVNGLPFKLASGVTGHGSRAKALKGIGNAIVPQVAAAFVRAFLEVEK